MVITDNTMFKLYTNYTLHLFSIYYDIFIKIKFLFMESSEPLKNTEVVFEKQQNSSSNRTISNYNELLDFISSGEGCVKRTAEEDFKDICEGLKSFIEYETRLLY